MLSCEYRSLRMFCNLSTEELEDLDSIGVQWRLPKGTILFQEEEPSDYVAVLCEGQVKLSCTSAKGKTLILKIAGPGDVLGLGAAIAGSPYEVTAEAIEPALVKNIRRNDFIAFLERHGDASFHAAQSLSAEYRTAFFDAKRLALAPSAAGRLASVLLQWGRNASCGKPQLQFTMSLTTKSSPTSPEPRAKPSPASSAACNAKSSSTSTEQPSPSSPPISSPCSPERPDSRRRIMGS